MWSREIRGTDLNTMVSLQYLQTQTLHAGAVSTAQLVVSLLEVCEAQNSKIVRRPQLSLEAAPTDYSSHPRLRVTPVTEDFCLHHLAEGFESRIADLQ